MKQIVFTAVNSEYEEVFFAPKPSSFSIPEWYKNIPKYMGNLKKLTVNENSEVLHTVKKCSPFLDALTSGYILTTPCDILVTKEEIVPKISWKLKVPIITHHQVEQTDDFPSIIWEDYYKMVFKWTNGFVINTPKNYSVLFTHPLNRVDLPFYTLSGIVETESFDIATNFPFVIKKDFEGIIPKGTPIVQIMPFKRESWESTTNAADEVKIRKSFISLDRDLFGYYKNNFWKKKQWR